MLKIRSTLDLGSHEDRAFWALILLLYFSVSRKGDNIPETRRKFKIGHHATKGCITIQNGVDGRYMVLERTDDKTSKLGGAFVGKPMPEVNTQLCAFTAIKKLNEGDQVDAGENEKLIPLFRHTNKDPITGPGLLSFLRKKLKDIGEVPKHYGTNSLTLVWGF